MATENVHAGHRKRLRDRFLASGLDSFLPHQMLELLLFYSFPREDTNVYAHRLLNRFGDLHDVFNASVEELCEVDGIGESTALLIKMIPELCDVFNSDTNERKALSTRRDICNYFSSVFENEGDERIYIACLDDMLNLNKLVDIGFVRSRFENGVIRRITEEIIKTNSTQCVIAINHPKSYAAPMSDEVDFAKRMDMYLRALDVKLAEFVIYGTDGIRLIMDSVGLGILN